MRPDQGLRIAVVSGSGNIGTALLRCLRSVSRAPVGALRWRRLPVLPLPTPLRFQAVHANDVAQACVETIRRRVGGAFNLAAEPPFTPELLARALESTHLSVPLRVAGNLATLSWHGHLQPTEPGWLRLAMGAPLLDSERARRLLDWQPAYDAEAAFGELIEGFARRAGTSSPILRPRLPVLARAGRST